MERVQEIFRQRQSLSYERFLDFTPLNRAQKSYLTEVYAVLGGSKFFFVCVDTYKF
jgi:hypothetical protein